MQDHQQHLSLGGGRDSIVMGKLKECLLLRLAALNPSISINSTHASFVEKRLQQLFTTFHTPTHPPYSFMIETAIMELDEETESTEEAISESIRRKYVDLPWAHERILHLHLRKLCLDGELVCTKKGRYTKCRLSKKRRSSRNRERTGILETGEGIDRDNGLQDQEIKDEILVSELRGARTNNLSRVIEQAQWTEEQGEVQWQSTQNVEEHGKSEEPQIQTIMEVDDKIVSSEVMNMKPYQTNLQPDLIISKHIQDGEQVLKNHCHNEKQQNGEYDELRELCDQQIEVIQGQNDETLIEHQAQIQQIEVTNEMTGFSSDEKTGDVNMSASHDDPTTIVIPEGNLAGTELTLMQSQLQMLCQRPSALNSVSESKMAYSLSFMDVHENHKEQHLNLGSANCMLKPVADYPGESLLPLADHIVYVDFGSTYKLGASLSYVNANELKQPQHWNQGSLKRNLGENTTFGDHEQPPLKRLCGGRPSNPKSDIDNLQVSLLPSNGCILSEQKPNIFKIEQQQYSQPYGNTHPRKD